MEREKRILEEDDKISFLSRAYLGYFKYGRIALSGPLLILVFGLAQLNLTSLDYFLKLWTDSISTVSLSNVTAVPPVDSNDTMTESNSFAKLIAEDAAFIYAGLTGCFIVLGLARVISLVIYCTRVSTEIHSSLFNRIVRAKMKFFYTNPVGIVLNRFSRDIGIVDNSIWSCLYDLLEVLTNDLVIYVMLAVANPWLMLPFCLFTFVVVFYRTFYIDTARALQTLEGVSKVG